MGPVAPIGVITGSGAYSLPGIEDAAEEAIDTPHGTAHVVCGRLGDVEVVHVSRHGAGHVRLSNNVDHLSNIAALEIAGVRAVIGCTACGAIDPSVALGSLIVFDDLHFPSNRLPDGSLATFYRIPGDRRRGHWILGDPYSAGLREHLVAAASDTGRSVRDGGVYGHVDGPRFNTRSEIAALGACGVTAVSQTGGPEAVLCGEARIPYALAGFATDYANGVSAEPTPVDELIRLLGESGAAFADLAANAVPRIAAILPEPSGHMYRFEGG